MSCTVQCPLMSIKLLIKLPELGDDLAAFGPSHQVALLEGEVWITTDIFMVEHGFDALAGSVIGKA